MSASVSVELARFARTRISDLGYETDDDGVAPEGLYGLKDRLHLGYGDTVLVNGREFSFTLPKNQYYQSIRKDLFDGMIRIKNLQKAAACLVSNGGATAWTLTTCYYASFFAALEVMRCSGKKVSYLNKELVGLIRQRATGPPTLKLEPGTYEGTASYLLSSNEVRITYAKRDIRHHDFTWTYLKQVVSQLHALTGIHGVMRDRLQHYIGTDNRPSWPSPSDTRNHWNYEAASLFGANGESLGAEFRKLCRNNSAAYGWAQTEQRHCSDGLCASSVAFVMSVLVDSAENLARALLPESLIKQRAFQKALS